MTEPSDPTAAELGELHDIPLGVIDWRHVVSVTPEARSLDINHPDGKFSITFEDPDYWVRYRGRDALPGDPGEDMTVTEMFGRLERDPFLQRMANGDDRTQVRPAGRGMGSVVRRTLAELVAQAYEAADLPWKDSSAELAEITAHLSIAAREYAVSALIVRLVELDDDHEGRDWSTVDEAILRHARHVAAHDPPA